MSDRESRARIARNFVDRYGSDALRRLLEALAQGESGQAIAVDLDVSRERVRQWKNAFGRTVTLYQVYTEVEETLRESP